MNKSPNGPSSSKVVSYGWFGEIPYVSFWKIFLFFHPLAIYLFKPMSQMFRAAAKHCGTSGHAHMFSICPPAAIGRHALLHQSTALKPCLFSSHCQPPWDKSWGFISALSYSTLKHSRRIHFSKAPVLFSRMRCFRSFRFGILKNRGSQKQFNQTNRLQKLHMKMKIWKLIFRYLFFLKLAGWRTAGIGTSCLLSYPHCLHTFQSIFGIWLHKEVSTKQGKRWILRMRSALLECLPVVNIKQHNTQPKWTISHSPCV